MNSFKVKLKQNRLKGYWSIIPNVQIHEIMAIAGFDFAIIDLEHGTYSFQEALESTIAIQSKVFLQYLSIMLLHFVVVDLFN